VKEVEYLRAQLKTFDAEEATMNDDPSQFDSQKSEQITQLQQLVEAQRYAHFQLPCWSEKEVA
jgi:mitotic spindle assembly checkpoint protein MAD1